MSYVSLLKNIPEIITQPIGIAALASVGIHGAIAMIVPLMPIDSNKPKETASSKTVGLLELSQADQSRLPQSTPQPQVGLQQLSPIAPLSTPNFNAQSVLPPLAPPATSQLVLPPLPPSANSYRVSSVPTRQSLRRIPNYNFGFDASKFDSSRYNSTPKFSPSVPSVPPASSLSESDRKYETPQPLAVNRLPQLQSQNIPDDILQSAQSQNLSDIPPVTTPQGNPTPQMTQPSNDASKISQNLLVNSIKQSRANSNTLMGTRGITSQASDLSPKGTQQTIAQLDSYAALKKEVEKEYPNAEQKPVIRQTVATDKPNVEGTVLGVLVVDPDGKVLDIKFQDKLLAPELRTKAREYFNKQSPKGDKKISSYPFNLVFQNNGSNTIGTTQDQKPFPLAPAGNNNQLTPLPGATSKPSSEAPIKTNQSAPLPARTLKPLVVPALTDAAKPSSQVEIKNNQPASLRTNTLKPLVLPRVNTNQTQPLPAVTSKPSSQLPIKNNQVTPSSAASSSSESLLTPRVNQNQATPTPESEQELLQQLRQLKQNRQKSTPEK
ncbi:MAG: hypothetical protein RMY62_010425 [Nostoc sp. ZfuVER08]|jgi:hypothetical protein|uniref:TonB C-terminal domain-containing protein n=1 Tax=Nostoc punctiforme FACHB-252 TaxID=1357509 RepID=A0ABR8HHB5_NOSPU|nr:hypothetical protein [Nostoc punctiforme]MBD2614888.1 hypothetical protein [Nostoc punctiforme FACHB-252]MDZ8013496.1 hypothetical protein [Nostoc sp. ZfuVER08]